MSNVGAAVMNNEADENGYEANNEENGYEEGGGFFMFSDEDEKAFVTGEKDFYNAFEEALADTGAAGAGAGAAGAGAGAGAVMFDGQLDEFGEIVALEFGLSNPSFEDIQAHGVPLGSVNLAFSPSPPSPFQSPQRGSLQLSAQAEESLQLAAQAEAEEAAPAAATTPRRSSRVPVPVKYYRPEPAQLLRRQQNSARASAAMAENSNRETAATGGSAVSRATKRTVLQRNQVPQVRVEPISVEGWARKATSSEEFTTRSELDSVCILCSCKMRERLSGNKKSGKSVNLAEPMSDETREKFKGVSFDHHLPINFLCALVGGITTRGQYTDEQFNIFALTGDIVCWNCNYVKNDTLFATLRRTRDNTFANLRVNEIKIQEFCNKLWENENTEGQIFLPADIIEAKRNGAKNTLQLAILRKMGEGTTLAQAKTAWMAHQIPILCNRTQLLLNKIRLYAWPRRAINRLKALGVAKRAQDKITEKSPEYVGLNSELESLQTQIIALSGNRNRQISLKAEASKKRTAMNNMKIKKGVARLLHVLDKLDKKKPVWLPTTGPTTGAISRSSNKTFATAYEFPLNAAERRAIARIDEGPALTALQIRQLLSPPAAEALPTIVESEEESNTGAFKKESLGLDVAAVEGGPVGAGAADVRGPVGAGGGARIANDMVNNGRQRKTRQRKRTTRKRKTRKNRR